MLRQANFFIANDKLQLLKNCNTGAYFVDPFNVQAIILLLNIRLPDSDTLSLLVNFTLQPARVKHMSS